METPKVKAQTADVEQEPMVFVRYFPPHLYWSEDSEKWEICRVPKVNKNNETVEIPCAVRSSGETFAGRVEGDQMVIAVAVCSEHDFFDKRKGQMIAVSRLKSKNREKPGSFVFFFQRNDQPAHKQFHQLCEDFFTEETIFYEQYLTQKRLHQARVEVA